MDSRPPWRSGKARRHSRRPNRLLPICRTPTFELFQNTKPQNPLKRGLCGLARPEDGLAPSVALGQSPPA